MRPAILPSPCRATVLAAALLGLLLSGPPAARAFTLNRTEQGKVLRWPSAEVPLVLGGVPDGVEPQPFADAVQAAFATWNVAADGLIVLDFQGAAAAGAAVGYDSAHPERNVNLVTVEHGEWSYDPNANAITITSYVTETGEILDADVLVNGRAREWAIGLPHKTDVQNSMTHEAGHFLGLGHSQLASATMFPTTSPGEQDKRALEPDDVAAVRALYGAEPPADYNLVDVDESGMVTHPLKGHLAKDESLQVQANCRVASGGRAGAGGLPLLLSVLAVDALRRRRTAARLRQDRRGA